MQAARGVRNRCCIHTHTCLPCILQLTNFRWKNVHQAMHKKDEIRDKSLGAPLTHKECENRVLAALFS